jgi:endonuclease-3
MKVLCGAPGAPAPLDQDTTGLGRTAGMAATAEIKRHARRVAKALGDAYPDAQCSLNFRTPLELLIATILSAQCTDARVNIVTKPLFKKYKSAQAFADADLPELEQDIKSTGFYRNKAKNIKGCCEKLVELYDGEVPRELDQLVVLPGVGRKTANVVLGAAFDIAVGVVVDTHVTRLSRRTGLTHQKDAVKIERDLMAELPQTEWVDLSHRMIQHGRRVCVARKPKCDICTLAKICPRVGVESASAISK